MEGGRIVQVRTPPRISFAEAAEVKSLLPGTSRFFAQVFAISGDGNGIEANSFVPLSIREGRKVLGKIAEKREGSNHPAEPRPVSTVKTELSPVRLVEAGAIWFRYDEGGDVIKKVSLNLFPGDIAAIVGGNGAGKSTLLQLLAGIQQPTKGSLQVERWKNGAVNAAKMAGTVGFLSQNPNDYLWSKTVEEEVYFTPRRLQKVDTGWIGEVMNALGLDAIKDRNPRQLSLGERMKVALAAVMACRPLILLLDEPTRGLDSASREGLRSLLNSLAAEGAGVILATHDMEFVGECVERVFLLHDGSLADSGSTREIMRESVFYTSPARRLFRGVDEHVVNWQDGWRWMAEYLIADVRGWS